VNEAGLKVAIAGQIRVGAHGWKGLHDDGLDIDAVRRSIVARGVIIEEYPNGERGPSALVLSLLSDSNPVHSVWAWRDLANEPCLIMVYRPKASGWSPDFRTRRA
jgi:hypothetical protein